MPIPKRRKGESVDDFLSRGHRALADEYPDPKQRYAVLMRQVRKSDLLDQLVQGVGVEREHTDDPLEAARIALDHLGEDPFYYTKLAALEGKPKVLDGMAQSMLELGYKGDGMDDGVRKAIEGVKVLARAVRKVAYEEGHVSHRSDGDYQKKGGEWQKLPASARQGQAGGAPATEPAKLTPEEFDQMWNMSIKRIRENFPPEKVHAYQEAAKKKRQAHMEELRAKYGEPEKVHVKTEGEMNAEQFARASGRAPGVAHARAMAYERGPKREELDSLDGSGPDEVAEFFKSYPEYDGPIPEGEDEDGNPYNARASDGILYWNDNYDSWNEEDDEDDEED